MPRTCLNCKYKNMVKENRPCLKCHGYSKHVFNTVNPNKISGINTVKTVNIFIPWQ